MENKILLLSNSNLFHYSFCSLYKKDFNIDRAFLRYLDSNLNLPMEHYYIQIKEQKRKRLSNFGVLSDPNKLILTNKSIEKIIEKCKKEKYNRIILEINTGSKEEVLLIKNLNKTKIPISVFVMSEENNLANVINDFEVDSLFHLSDLFNCKALF